MTKKSRIGPRELEVFSSLINGAVGYMNAHDLEKTQRQQIKADLTRDMQRVQAERDVLENYLRKTFSERKEVIDKMFLRLDRALDEDRGDVAIQALASIEGIVKESPLEALLQTRKALETPGAVLEI